MKKVIVTVGPVLFEKHSLQSLHEDNYIYRINGAHGDVSDIKNFISKVRKAVPQADILIDLPGNKIRTAGLIKPLELKRGELSTLPSRNINYKECYRFIQKGDVILADDSTLKMTVASVDRNSISFISEFDGILRNNKGLHIQRVCDEMPFLLEKDKQLIDLINAAEIDYAGLSYVRTASDIDIAQEFLREDTTIIAKVETKAAIENVHAILERVEHILIDRGDLSTQVGLAKVPYYQKYIIEKASLYNRKVFLATQFLSSMVEKPVPTIAEVIDLYNTLTSGVYGLQLSEETAVGKYPQECLNVIKRILEEIKVGV